MVTVGQLDKILRYCLIFEVGATIAVLVLTAIMASWFQGSTLNYPYPPGKLSWNIAVAAITTACFLAMSITRRVKKNVWEKMLDLKWSWPRLVVHLTLFIFWIAASGTAFWTCDDICSPVKDRDYWVYASWYSDTACVCNSIVKRASVPKYRTHSSGDGSGGRSAYHAAQALDILLMFSFLITSVLIAYRWHLDNRGSSNGSEMQERANAGPEQTELTTESYAQPEYQQQVPKHDSPYEGV